MTEGEGPLACERPMSVLGLGEGGKPDVCFVWEGDWLGTTQEECKVLIISGLSETFEEVLLITE